MSEPVPSRLPSSEKEQDTVPRAGSRVKTGTQRLGGCGSLHPD